MPVMFIVLILQALEGLNPLTVPQFARVHIGDVTARAEYVAPIEQAQGP